MGLLLEITGAGLGPRWAQSIKGTRCSNSVLTHSWPPFSQRERKKCIYIWSLRNFQSCCLEDGSWLPWSSWMLSAYKCPLTCFGGSACVLASASIYTSKDFYLKKNKKQTDLITAIHTPPADTRATTTGSTYSDRCPLTHTVSQIIVSHHQYRLIVWSFPSACERVHVNLHGDINFERTPPMPKLLWKGNPHPDPHSPHSPFLWLAPSFLQWHTLGDCASLSASHTTFSTQHCQPSNSICLPFRSQLSFAWGKWAVASQAWKKKRSVFPPCTWCITNLLCCTCI